MPICTACKQDKPNADFFLRDKLSRKLHRSCKVCYTLKRKAYYKEHYARYGDTYRARAKARKIAVKQVTRQKLAEYLIDKCCAHCGNSDSRVLEFDHLDAANKSFGISRAFDNSLSWERILAEIQKCQILCANCHRIRTAEQFGWSKSVR